MRVADFGLSRVTHDLNTLTGGLGTFQYMAPEVMANQRYSVKADVYSFGMVLWECTARQVCKAMPSSYRSAATSCGQQYRYITVKNPCALNTPVMQIETVLQSLLN